ncbi:hypothetical protein BpHYR1_029830, partial [Brachionus plicatilis]
MTSDHYPVQLKLNSNYISINQASLEKFSYDFNRADWVKFKSLLCNSQYEDCSDLESNNIEAIASKLTNELNNAASGSIPAKTQNLYKNSIFDSEIDIGNCFGETLKDTFSLNNDFINVSSDREVHKFVNDYFNKKQSIKFVEITLSELKEAINKAKDQSAM